VLLAEFRLYPAVIRHFEDAVRANPLRTRRGTTSPMPSFRIMRRPKRSSPCSKPRLRHKKTIPIWRCSETSTPA
jgi:hypothetical protein